ncbi:UNVERIFIED_CONTAM: hypothetical protein PYX00_001222 [Menopon gallinae]|uniref:Uncharacterized protein n=1 Tax=Menopon gallinae TaxID=328185 RepID=A0AAW2IBQ0_9NEOP
MTSEMPSRRDLLELCRGLDQGTSKIGRVFSAGLRRALRIVIPSKIRYVHHHHTHVVVMKPQKSPDAKYHHLHYYPEGSKRSKGVNHHFYIPIAPPAEDDVEDESMTKYAVAHPKDVKSDSYGKFPSVYEEPPPLTSPKKYERSAYDPEEDPDQYYEADPLFPVDAAGEYRPLTYDYELLKLQPKYLIHRKGPLFFPEAKPYRKGAYFP